MDNLEKLHLIKKENLNETYYFQSILQEAHGFGLLSDLELENIQMQCIQLLAKQTECYTGGDSSSVKVETAQSIMLSIFYTVGSYLKSFSDVDMSIEILRQKPLLEMYQNGKKIIRIQLDCAKELYDKIQMDNIITENYAYNDTLQKGIQIFFNSYDVDYAANDTPASIDYPLSNDKMDLVGIDYISSYLEKLFLENQFCKNFTEHDIECLLRGYNDNYKDLLINIFGLVLTNLVGSLLAKKNKLQLDIKPFDRQYIQEKLGNMSINELDIILHEASDKICKVFNISDRLLQKHIFATVMDLQGRVKNALENNRLDSIFISLKENNKQSGFQFKDGAKMEDEIFRSIIEEIRQCRYISDKIAIIKRKIHSIIDLIDILEGDCIFDNEFSEVFKSLGDMGIAILLKNIPIDTKELDYHTIENEKEWYHRLNCFLQEIDLIRGKGIGELSQKINLD